MDDDTHPTPFVSQMLPFPCTFLHLKSYNFTFTFFIFKQKAFSFTHILGTQNCSKCQRSPLVPRGWHLSSNRCHYKRLISSYNNGANTWQILVYRLRNLTSSLHLAASPRYGTILQSKISIK